MRRAGLRTRVTAGFAAGALVLSTSMALLSYLLTRESLLEQRETAAVRAAYVDGAVVEAGLAGGHPDIVGVLRSLDTGGNRRAVLRRNGAWYSRNADAGLTSAIPDALRRHVEAGRPGMQRIRTDGQPMVVVGLPLDGTTAFYQMDSLRELDRTLQALALVLTAAAMLTAAGGAALGWYATRYVMRPLSSVAAAAQEIAAGDFSARLDPTTEPDLVPLTTSFNQMVDELSQRLARDRRFAADVSHELRSPLQTLSAAAAVLARRRPGLDDRTAAAAGLVADEVSRFQALVNDLLELARSDQPAHRAPVDVVELARQVCRARRLSPELVRADPAPAAGAGRAGPVGPGAGVGSGSPADGVADAGAGVERAGLEGAGAGQLIWHVDRRRLEQLLGNLLDNAVTHGGGPVAVRLGRHGERCVIEVDDEGPGVSPEDRTTIFDRFVRGRAAAARGGSDGTGLGLALVAQHAAAHGGRAAVQDRPGGGARFRVELSGCLP